MWDIYLPSPVSLSKAIFGGISSYEDKSFILVLSVEFKCSTLEKIMSVLYTSTSFFAACIVFSL